MNHNNSADRLQLRLIFNVRAWRGIAMSLLGEEVVEEWLNRNGYFTIRKEQ
jgi:hypothetical protein